MAKNSSSPPTPIFPILPQKVEQFENAKVVASLMSLQPGCKTNSAARMQRRHLAATDLWPLSKVLATCGVLQLVAQEGQTPLDTTLLIPGPSLCCSPLQEVS